MNTRLVFEAPADLSVGRVTVRSENGVVGEWIATPDQRIMAFDNAPPGLYVAEIAPPGVRPLSFVFEVQAGIANEIEAPPFMSLAAGGNAAAFSGIVDPHAAIERLHRSEPDTAAAPPDETVREIYPIPVEKAPRSAGAAKTLSIGLAQKDVVGEANAWRPYEGPATVTFEGSALNLVLAPGTAEPGPFRVLLSVALEGVGVERLLVPLFRGGTAVTVQPSSLTTADLAIQVMPIDPRRRALVRALLAGTHEEAAAVRDYVVPSGGSKDFFEGPESDPWAAMLAALLTIRFPDVFGASVPSWAPDLVKHCGWAFDAHVVNARHHLVSAPKSTKGRKKAAKKALRALICARRQFAPYFSYSNELFREMLAGLSTIESLDPKLAALAKRQVEKWQAKLPLQRTVGISFSWQRTDLALRAEGKVEPYRRTHGNLNKRHSNVVFRGRLDLAPISLLSAVTKPKPPKETFTDDALQREERQEAELAAGAGPLSEPLSEPPALKRALLARDDPNKGRFGGVSNKDGYTLSASFRETSSSRWVEIHLAVRADPSIPPTYSDVVEFFLHPTFNPSRVKAVFRGREASLSVRAWGGFTVGAWLPRQQVELECDLASLSDAPRIIREL